ncbi:hypothetical protein Tco_0073718 [Tanacetum coccineum]
MGLESLEARIVVHEKNEAAYEEDIAFLKYDVQVKDISIKDLKNQLEEALKEKDDLKLKLENFEESSKNLTKLINSQISAKDKAGLGQKTIRPSAPNSDNDSVFRPKPDQTKLKFTKINFVKSDENVKSVNKENTHRQEEYPRKSPQKKKRGGGFSLGGNRRNWNGLMTQKLGNGFESIKKACFVCGSFNHLIKDCDFHDKKMIEKPVLNNKGRVTGQREIRPVWNNAQRVNHQNKFTHPHPKRNFVPTAVVTKSGQVPVNTAKQSSPRAAASISTARPVNTAAPKSKVNDALPKTYSYFKAHSPVRRAFNQKSAAKTYNLNEKVKQLVRVNPTIITTLQDQGIFDSGCSRHMTGNKSFLTDYQEVDGGFVAFAGSPKGAEYVAAANCCGQVLWIQNQMLDYGFNFMNTKIHIDNESTICIVKNLVFHSKTKHIEIRHHFIRDSYEKKLVQVIKIHTDHNVADLLTKAFDVSRKVKRTTEISQSSGPIHLVADETVYKEWEDRMERAATTASSLEAEQDNGAKIPYWEVQKLKLVNAVRLNLLLPVLVYAARHSLTTVRHKLMLSGITFYCWFLTSAKVKTVNGERQIQALVDKKKVIISKTSIRSDLKLDDAEGTDCLPNATIFSELERMGIMASAIICLATNQKFNLSKYIFDNMVKNLDGGVKFLMYPRFVQIFLDKQVEGMSKHKGVNVTPSHTKKVFANMKRPCKGFSGRVTPLFSIMMVQATEDMGADSATPTDSHFTSIITQPSSSKPQKKKSRRKQRKDSAPTEPTTEETTPEEHVSTPSYDPPPSGKDKMQLAELMSLCTNLQEKVLDLEKAKTTQAKEINSLKKRFKQLEKRRKSRTSGLRSLRKGKKIKDLNADAEVTLVNETHEMNDDNLMFDTGMLEEQEIEFEKVVEEPAVNVATSTKSIPVSAAEVVTTASASVVITDELTLAQTLIEIKTSKPKPVTTAATTVTSVRPRAKGIIFHDQEEHIPASTKTFSSSQSQLSQVKGKGKGKGKLVEPEVPFKKNDQVALDEEMARNIEAQL